MVIVHVSGRCPHPPHLEVAARDLLSTHPRPVAPAPQEVAR